MPVRYLIIASDRFLSDLVLTVAQALPQSTDRVRNVGLAAPDEPREVGVAGNSPVE